MTKQFNLGIGLNTTKKQEAQTTELGNTRLSAIQEITERLIVFLRRKASEIRALVVQMISNAESGHIGGCFSAADLLTVLYYYKMQIDYTNCFWENRDRFILSKGHSAPLLYSILMDLGILEKTEINSLRRVNSRLQGHPNILTTPGVDISSGSLGMGISVGCGMALAAKLDNKNYKTYVLLGDGELQEGQNWEAVMTASHYQLDNLIVIVDKNNLQTDSPVKSVINSGEITDQFKAFDWNVIEIDGHNIREILHAFNLIDLAHGKPTVIIAETCKGKGVSFMENNPIFHGNPPSREEVLQAIEELSNDAC